MSKKKTRTSSPQGSHESQARKRREKALRGERRKRRRIALVVAGAAVVLVVIVVAWSLHAQRESMLRDLSNVGRGVPSIVQVHDVQCPVCSELRRNVERVARDFSDEDLVIRIADIRSDDGLAFASRHTTARRTTLLFIDGEGELVDIRSGLQSEESLRRDFEEHAGRN